MAHSVLIAGAGVGGIEALLALDELAGDLVTIELLAPADSYVQRAQLVAQPFGGPEPARIELTDLTAETGAHHIRDSLAAVDAAAGVATTSGGRSLRFDSLLVAVGAIAEPGIAGALTFPGPPAEFARVLEQLGHREMRRIAFAVPPGTEWSLPAYELALLTAAEVRARRLEGVEVILITHEREPLKVAGPPAVSLVEARLAEAGVELITGARALGFEAGELELEDREAVRADAVIGLARLRGPTIEGLPSTPAGFLAIDVQMHVDGLDSVWAVGDATSHPIKQGGLAAQQAEIAAAGIATRAGARVPRRGFDPVLRATMVTGGPAEYIRARIAGGDEASTADGRALWWPAAKVAGERLSARLSLTPVPQDLKLVDVRATAEAGSSADPSPPEPAELLLAAADADAGVGDYAGALGWLKLVEQLDFMVPADHLARRAEWRRLAGEADEADGATRRLDSQFGSADAALSDVRRRIGWLREIGKRNGGEMADHLERLSADLERAVSLSKRAGIR